jgi:hypothetical protein
MFCRRYSTIEPSADRISAGHVLRREQQIGLGGANSDSEGFDIQPLQGCGT